MSESQTAPLLVSLSVEQANFRLDVEAAFSAQSTGVFGPSGAGKTTLLESIAGLRKGATGTIRWGEHVWLDSNRRMFTPPERRGIGYVPQQSLLFPHLNVRANLRTGLRRAALDSSEATAWMGRIVEVLDLRGLLNAAVHELSGGEQQRVALGRALCSGPRLLLLDEPLASLDLALRHRILRFLLEIRSAFAIPMIVVSHQPLELQALCDEIMVLHEGSIRLHGTPHDVFTHPDILPLVAAEGHLTQGYVNVLQGSITEISGSTAHLAVGSGNATTALRIPAENVQKGDAATVSVAADSIIVATSRPEGISARNVLSAQISRIESRMQRANVYCRLDESGTDLIVEITEEAIRELDLAEGREVFLLIKTNAVHLIL